MDPRSRSAHPRSMPGDLPPPQRLLQAVCWPGHGVLLLGRRVVLWSGDAALLSRAAQALPALEPGDRATRSFDDELVVCCRRQGDHVLAVLVPNTLDTSAVHHKLDRAIALYAASSDLPWTPTGGGGPSGAPAEVSVARVRPRPS
jgi:hypothetical protein